MPDDYEHVLVEKRGLDNYPFIYKLNTFTGEKELVEDGHDEDINEWIVDKKGNVRLGLQTNKKIKVFTRNSQQEWEGRNELNLDMDGVSLINQKINFLDFDYNDSIIYLASCANNPRWQVLRYNVFENKCVDTVLSDKYYDIGNPLNEDTKLLFLDSDKELIGIRYERNKPFTKWFSKKFQAYQDSMNNTYPGYFADIFDWNKDGSVVLIHLYSDTDPGYIMVYNSKTNIHAFYVIYAEDLKNMKLSKTKMINFTSRDGYQLEGYLNMPLTKTSSGSPLVVMPHGGPYARDYWYYDPEVQFFTYLGYAVLRVNFRGSTGYGPNHLLSGVTKISTVMIDDINDGVKWLINNKFVDSNNVFIFGHSYGGYAAIESIIRYPELYKAGVAIGAPTDIVKLIDYLDEKDNEFNYEFWKTTIGNPDNQKEYLKSISPIYNIDKISRPLFMFHGELDQIVPVSQTNDFIQAAQDHGKKFESKIILDEDHSISENRNIEYVLKKSNEFFREYLNK